MKRIIRLLLTVISAVFLFWFAAPVAYGVCNIGTALGMILSGGVLFRCGFANVYDGLKRRLCRHKATRAVLRVVQTGASLFLVYAVLLSGCMVYAMIPRETGEATAVVLGAQVKPWGPSVLLRQRIDAAEDYLAEHPDAKAIVTGGQGSDEVISEGQCMYDVMTADGIDSDRILIEDQAKNTEQNIRFSLHILEENRLNKEIAVVSDSYHQLRARIIAHKTDRTIRVIPVNTKNSHIGMACYATYFVREWAAIPIELLKRY